VTRRERRASELSVKLLKVLFTYSYTREYHD